MASETYVITGRVVSRASGEGIRGAAVEVWDKDLLRDDLVGSAVTGAGGSFRIQFDESYFDELFGDRRPDLYFRVAVNGRPVLSTEESVLWNVAAGSTSVSLEVGAVGDLAPAGEAEPAAAAGTGTGSATVAVGVPYLVSLSVSRDAAAKMESVGAVKVAGTPLPAALRTLGHLSAAVEVRGPESFEPALLVQPLGAHNLAGIDESTVRMFRLDEAAGRLRPMWDSGFVPGVGLAWSKVREAGTYVPIGLPRDRLLQEALRTVARERRLAAGRAPQEWKKAVDGAFAIFLEAPDEALQELREFLTRMEVQTGYGLQQLKPHEIRTRQGNHLAPFPLPQDEPLESFRKRLMAVREKLLAARDTNDAVLPEEELFYPPDVPRDGEPPWDLKPASRPWNGIDWRVMDRLQIWQYIDISIYLPWLFSQDWWMYQHDDRHTGAASGASDITSTTAHRMRLQSTVPVDGPVITKPAIVDGKVYVGSGNWGGGGGTMHKIDLATGNVEGRFATSGVAFYTPHGVGGSPAVVDGKVYFTAVHGKVYCVDAASMTTTAPHPPALWVTDLKNPDSAKNQPIRQPNGDCWSGPLVVNGKVYVGCGEGEEASTYGFVVCLDAATGRVLWLFCTSKFTNRLAPGSENAQNVIPASVAVSNPLPAWATAAGFSLYNDSATAGRETGASVWSSCAYDQVLNRIYVGTGNSQYKSGEPSMGADLPDEWYGSGLISLDANTGQFRAFFQPAPDDSYRPTDGDVDVPGSASVFSRGAQRVVAFGSKNGSFFLLDAATLQVLGGGAQRRQLLPRAGGSGLPGDRGTAISTVAPTSGPYYENEWGMYATPAVHRGSGKLFVGLGGRGLISDPSKTPFVRALDWNTLQDAWPTAVASDGVARYTAASPPLYTSSEVGLSSPAVVNDVVFVSTNKTAMYALDVADGHCLWVAPGLPAGQFALGPAISGNHVVVGAGSNVYIYVLRPRWIIFRPDLVLIPWWERVWPPPPDPPPFDPIPPWPGPQPLPVQVEREESIRLG